MKVNNFKSINKILYNLKICCLLTVKKTLSLFTDLSSV